MDTSKETVLRELISMCYDIVVEEASKTENPTEFYIKFFRELFKAEIGALKDEYGVGVSGTYHPITAIKKYRILNVKSYEYRFIDEIKPIDTGDDFIRLRQWRCSYLHNCIKHKHPLCIRGIAMGLAIHKMAFIKRETPSAMDPRFPYLQYPVKARVNNPQEVMEAFQPWTLRPEDQSFFKVERIYLNLEKGTLLFRTTFQDPDLSLHHHPVRHGHFVVAVNGPPAAVAPDGEQAAGDAVIRPSEARIPQGPSGKVQVRPVEIVEELENRLPVALIRGGGRPVVNPDLVHTGTEIEFHPGVSRPLVPVGNGNPLDLFAS